MSLLAFVVPLLARDFECQWKPHKQLAYCHASGHKEQRAKEHIGTQERKGATGLPVLKQLIACRKLLQKSHVAFQVFAA